MSSLARPVFIDPALESTSPFKVSDTQLCLDTTLALSTAFPGLISSFNKFVISADVKIKEVTLHAAAAVQAKQLTAQEFALKISF